MKIWTLDVGDLFKVLGMHTTGPVEMNDNTYDFDPDNPKDSWLYTALLGFLKLKQQGFRANSFATIGTGSGIDSVGVFEIFKPSKIYQVDIHPNVPELADKNAKAIIKSGAEVETFWGDLCTPLVERNIKVDLVYANIPNVPSDDQVLDKKVSASQFKVSGRDVESCPEIFQKWLLVLQYLFLRQAKQILNPSGVVVDAIGARVPYEFLELLYTLNGYAVQELVSVYKIQSEPEDAVPGYAKHEKEHGLEFDFYDHDKAWPFWQNELQSKNLKTPELKEALKSFRISASEALEAFEKHSRQCGHICSILAGTL